MSETMTIFNWGQLADCLLKASDIARPDSVPVGTMRTEKLNSDIVRMTIVVDLIPKETK